MTEAPADSRSATVSIILPTLNERGWIHDCLSSLLRQDEPSVVEVLVVDGGSTDGTRAIVAGASAPVRLLDNPRVTAAAAMNIGIEAARGDVIVRADAHTIYASDYVRRCREVLIETGAANVGGPMRPEGTTRFGRAVAAVTTSPLGVGPGRFHYSTRREIVDTVYLGCFWRAALVELGGYDDTDLQWAAEDQELNLRIRQRGGVIVLDPSISSTYFPRDTPTRLAKQYFNYGVCKASTLRKHRTLPTWRPIAPAALVAATAMLLPVRRLRFAIPVLYALGSAAVTPRVAGRGGARRTEAWAALAICHWAYGLGVWFGGWRVVRRRGFTTRPGGHR